MMTLIIHIVGNALALYVANQFIKGVSFEGTIVDLLLAGFILGVLNFFVKPVLKIISTPLIILTLGLFIFIINIFILWLLQYLLPELTIDGFWAYFWTILILSAINFFFNHYLNNKD